jgi:hypothetical protein
MKKPAKKSVGKPARKTPPRTQEKSRPKAARGKIKLSRLVLHPLLFGAFPILFLFAYNSRESQISEILLPLAITVAVTAVVTLGLGLLLRNFYKSGIIASIGVGVFFGYGRLVDLTRDWQVPFRQIVILSLLAAAAIAGIVFLLRTKRDLLPLTKILNFAAGVLVAIQLVLAAVGLWSLRPGNAQAAEAMAPSGAVAPVGRGAPAGQTTGPEKLAPAECPDIYYIILDGYGRADMVARYYNYDNSAFVGFLEEKGFHVFSDARPNYCQTLLCLSSVLNMDYIDDFITLDKNGDDRIPLMRKLRKNALFAYLKSKNYSIVAFSSGYEFTEIPDADVRLTPSGALSEFQNILLTTTTMSIMDGTTAFDEHRRRIAYILNTLPVVPSDGRPRFVFAHIVCPHPPFVFGPDGEKVKTNFSFSLLDGDGYMGQGGTVEEYTKGYFDQVTYLNKLVRVAVSQILAANPLKPPVIVLQADHGPGIGMNFLSLQRTNLKDRFAMLYALYLPGYVGKWPAPLSSPVNTFRFILNRYGGADLPLLEPRNYYSTWPRPFIFTDVTAMLDDEPAVTPNTGKAVR